VLEEVEKCRKRKENRGSGKKRTERRRKVKEK
jgi:hypothetical protein